MHLGEFYGPGYASGSSVTGSTQSLPLLYPDQNRRGAAFFNHANGSLFLKLGDGATVTDFTVKLSSGSYYEMPYPVHTGSITGVWDAAGGRVMVTVLRAGN